MGRVDGLPKEAQFTHGGRRREHLEAQFLTGLPYRDDFGHVTRAEFAEPRGADALSVGHRADRVSDAELEQEIITGGR